MSKKIVCGIGIVIVLLLCGAVYFRPLSFPKSVTEDRSFIAQVNDFGVRDGEPYIDSDSYDDITEAQKEKIIGLLKEYSYQRTLKTYVSDGSLEKVGSRVVFLYIYDHDTLSESIYVSDTGQISVNDRLYQMKDSEQFNDRLESILNG